MNDAELRKKAETLMQRLEREAGKGGYHLNPDKEMVIMLCAGLIKNIERYGYPGCPCRLMEGDKIKDLDVICPCDYRDPDLARHGVCYCALYVTQDVVDGRREVGSIPERRLPEPERKAMAKQRRKDPASVGIKVWRCRVCGYLMAMEGPPPEQCPVCTAKRDRFEVFTFSPATNQVLPPASASGPR